MKRDTMVSYSASQQRKRAWLGLSTWRYFFRKSLPSSKKAKQKQNKKTNKYTKRRKSLSLNPFTQEREGNFLTIWLSASLLGSYYTIKKVAGAQMLGGKRTSYWQRSPFQCWPSETVAKQQSARCIYHTLNTCHKESKAIGIIGNYGVWGLSSPFLSLSWSKGTKSATLT